MKESIEYSVPIQTQSECDEFNKMCNSMYGKSFKPIKPTEQHVEALIKQFKDAIHRVGNEGGWYTGEGIDVKIELKYKPENK